MPATAITSKASGSRLHPRKLPGERSITDQVGSSGSGDGHETTVGIGLADPGMGSHRFSTASE